MYIKNDGNGSNAVQNKFTAYLKIATRNYRIDYMKKKAKTQKPIVPLDDFEYMTGEEVNFIMAIAEYDALKSALKKLSDKERDILLERILGEKSFEELGQKYGIAYKGAAAIFYRTLAKLRTLLGGNENGF